MSDEDFKAKLKSLQLRGTSTRREGRTAERMRDYVEGGSRQTEARREAERFNRDIDRKFDPEWFAAERGKPVSENVDLPD